MPKYPLRPQQPMDTIAFDTDGAATGLEQVVSSVAERMLPEIIKKLKRSFLSGWTHP